MMLKLQFGGDSRLKTGWAFFGQPSDAVKRWIIGENYYFTIDSAGNAYINGNDLDPECVMVSEQLDKDGNLFV